MHADGRARVWRLLLIGAASVALGAVATWRLLRPTTAPIPPAAEAAAGPGAGDEPTAPILRTPTAREPRAPRPTPGSEGAVAATANLEDARLHEPILQPKTATAPPPRPPRASVDPEPQAPDDPHDFDLPAPDRRVR
jgi:hypothetical protein